MSTLFPRLATGAMVAALLSLSFLPGCPRRQPVTPPTAPAEPSDSGPTEPPPEVPVPTPAPTPPGGPPL